MHLDHFERCLAKRLPPVLGPANLETIWPRRLAYIHSLGHMRYPYSAADMACC